MRIALAQINPVVGDLVGNTAETLRQIEAARSAGAVFVAFPELSILGYPPRDLLLRRDLLERNRSALNEIASHCREITAIVGFAESNESVTGCFNAAGVCSGGRVVGVYRKWLLPGYDVFDEPRYFTPGNEAGCFEIQTGADSIRVGLTICEDLWNDRQFNGRKMYGADPVRAAVEAGAELLVNLSASPYRTGVQAQRESLFAGQAREYGLPLAFVSQVGANDDLVFDGASVVFDRSGQAIARAHSFREDLLVVDLDDPAGARKEAIPDRLASVHQALVMGVRDYLRKNGFDRVVLGLSGGIDSALTAALAVAAIGPDRVRGVSMPSRFSSSHSVEDARALASNLGISLDVIGIEGVHSAMETAVEPLFAGAGPPGVAEENIQARVRGNILMALANKTGALLLATGNKSEIAVGYCTLYGDLCGGLAVLSDVPKTVVYELSRRINDEAGRFIIPERTIAKPPSAELRANQVDQDSLPPYDVLDAILERYVERKESVEQIVAAPFDRATVDRVIGLVLGAEHKRKQMPVGLKVTARAFGTGWRNPISVRLQ